MVRKKILFFLSNLNGGGAQRTVINILNNIDKTKFEPQLILLEYSKQQAYASILTNDISIVNLNSKGRFSILKINRIIKRENPDVIFSTLPHVNIIVSIAHKLANSNAKLILRETNHRKKEEMSSTFFRLLKWSYNYCDSIIALSKGVSNDLTMYEVDSRKVNIIYNPVDISKINSNIRLNNENQVSKAIKLIACGRLVPQKNFTLLIKALGNIDKQFRNWRLDILGEGPEKDKLIKLTNYYGLQDKINFLGFQDNPYLHMSEADLFILSSKWEGFGHVIVEAMASGTPVLSSDCPHGPSEILEEGKYGWLFRNNDQQELEAKLLHLVKSPNDILKMGENANKRANDFDVKVIVQDYEEVFSKVQYKVTH